LLDTGVLAESRADDRQFLKKVALISLLVTWRELTWSMMSHHRKFGEEGHVTVEIISVEADRTPEMADR